MKLHVLFFAGLFALAAAAPTSLMAVGKRYAGTSAVQFLKMGADARAAGMGEAHYLSKGEAVFFYHFLPIVLPALSLLFHLQQFVHRYGGFHL